MRDDQRWSGDRFPRARYRVHEIKHNGAFLLDCTARPFRKSDVTPQAGQRKRAARATGRSVGARSLY